MVATETGVKRLGRRRMRPEPWGCCSLGGMVGAGRCSVGSGVRGRKVAGAESVLGGGGGDVDGVRHELRV